MKPKDIGMTVPEVKLPVIMVEDGAPVEENLRLAGLSREALMETLAPLGVTDLRELSLAYLDSGGVAHVVRKPPV